MPLDRGPDKDTGLNNPKTTPARNFGFFPTPDAAAEMVIGEARLYRPADQPPLVVLEPSAGTGNLARRAVTKGAVVDCVEIQSTLAAQLTAAGIYRRVTSCDFLSLQPDPGRLYDRIIMNPPFDRERDIDHVMHALKFLKPEGYLTAIMSAATEYGRTRKCVAFRELMTSMKAQWRDLPAGSFAEVGTNVNTVILKVYKDGRNFH